MGPRLKVRALQAHLKHGQRRSRTTGAEGWYDNGLNAVWNKDLPLPAPVD
jgi:hypothetical protein